MFIRHHYRQALKGLASPVNPTPVQNPVLRHVNHSLLADLDLDPELFEQQKFFAELFHPKGLLSANAIAQKYGGHQFGQWNPDLGDGRGLLLAETQDKLGKPIDLHLKGAGKTPYSRFADGRAVLRSTIREYLVSEAMHHLGIPSSRSLCLISSDEPVHREKIETAAMMIRTCPSHIRFGHFEYFFYSGEQEKWRALFDFTLDKYFPHLVDSQNAEYAFLQQVVADTALLIAKWQAFGFAHGVMNTDNMSIHGITFDFGPYTFMDGFEPGLISNHSDHQGRYSFDNQPSVGLWNLNAFAHSFSHCLSVEEITQALSDFEPLLISHYEALMLDKFGLVEKLAGDLSLIQEYLQLVKTDQRDYAISLRLLAEFQVSDDDNKVKDHFINGEAIQGWIHKYSERLSKQTLSAQDRRNRMLKANPKYLLRNYLAHKAIEQAEQGDYSEFERLLKVLEKPYDEQPHMREYAAPPPDWGKELEISCSS